jgi:hypothetical protein
MGEAPRLRWTLCPGGPSVPDPCVRSSSASQVQDGAAITPSADGNGQGAVSDSGSEMGAADGCQARSEAVTLPGWMPLTCWNVIQQRLCRVVRSVRIEVVRSYSSVTGGRLSEANSIMRAPDTNQPSSAHVRMELFGCTWA